MKKGCNIKCYKLILLKKSKYQDMAKARGTWLIKANVCKIKILNFL